MLEEHMLNTEASDITSSKINKSFHNRRTEFKTKVNLNKKECNNKNTIIIIIAAFGVILIDNSNMKQTLYDIQNSKPKIH